MHFFILEPCATPEKHESQGGKKKKKGTIYYFKAMATKLSCLYKGSSHYMEKLLFKNLLKKELLQELYHFIKSK